MTAPGDYGNFFNGIDRDPDDPLDTVPAESKFDYGNMFVPTSDEEAYRSSMLEAQSYDTAKFNTAVKAGDNSGVARLKSAIAGGATEFDPNFTAADMAEVEKRIVLLDAIARDRDLAVTIGPGGYGDVGKDVDSWYTGPVQFGADILGAAKESIDNTQIAYWGTQQVLHALGATDTVDITEADAQVAQLQDALVHIDANDYGFLGSIAIETARAAPFMGVTTAGNLLGQGAGYLGGAAAGLIAPIPGVKGGMAQAGRRIGGTAGAVAAAAALEGGLFMADMVRSRPDRDRGDLARMSVVVGGVNGGLEIFPFGRLAKNAKGMFKARAIALLSNTKTRTLLRRAFSKIGGQAGVEFATEFAQEFGSITGDVMLDVQDGRITMREAGDLIFSEESFRRALEVAKAGAKGGAGLSSIPTTVNFVRDLRAVKRAEKVQEYYDGIARQAKVSKLRAANPEKYNQLMSDAAEGVVEALYIDLDVFTDVYVGNGTTENQGAIDAYNELLKSIPDLEAQVHEAFATGSNKIRIEPGDFATYIAGSAEYSGLSQGLSRSMNEASLVEAKRLSSPEAIAQAIAAMGELARTSEMREDDIAMSEGEVADAFGGVFEAAGVSVTVSQHTAAVFSKMLHGLARIDGRAPLEVAMDALERISVERVDGLTLEGPDEIVYSQGSIIRNNALIADLKGTALVSDDGSPMVVFPRTLTDRPIEGEAEGVLLLNQEYEISERGASGRSPGFYAKINNPIDLSSLRAPNDEVSQELVLALEAKGFDLARLRGGESYQELLADPEFVDALKIEGFDGAFFPETDGDTQQSTLTYAVFDPTQLLPVQDELRTEGLLERAQKAFGSPEAVIGRAHQQTYYESFPAPAAENVTPNEAGAQALVRLVNSQIRANEFNELKKWTFEVSLPYQDLFGEPAPAGSLAEMSAARERVQEAMEAGRELNVDNVQPVLDDKNYRGMMGSLPTEGVWADIMDWRELQALDQIASIRKGKIRKNVLAAQRDIYRQEGQKKKAQIRGQMEVVRGTGNIIIRLNKGLADDSTLIHELTHATLEILMDAAGRDDASQKLIDYQTEIFNWFGIENRAQLRGEHHEKFAQTMELYLIRNEAPAARLRMAFRWFRSRMARLYKNTATQLPHADHDLEVASIFDQLISTDEEILAGSAEVDIIDTLAQYLDLLPKEEGAKYLEALRAARTEQREKADEISFRAQSAKQKALVSGIRTEVTEEVMSRPDQRARFWLRRGELPLGQEFTDLVLPPSKLNRGAVESLYGDAFKLLKLPRGMMSSKGKSDPAIVATAFGFDGPYELLDALERSEDPKTLITEETAARAEARGLTQTDDQLRASGASAHDTDARDALYEAERTVARLLKVHESLLGRQEQRDIAGERAPTAQEAAQRVRDAEAVLEKLVARGASQAERDLAQTELLAARAGVRVAKDARADQRPVARATREALTRIPPGTLKAAAKQAVGEIIVLDLPRTIQRWKAARTRASRAKMVAAAARDWDAVEQHISQEQFTGAFVGRGADVLQETRKWKKALKKYKNRKGETVERLGKHAPSFLKAIDGALDNVNFIEASNKRLATAESLQEFAEKAFEERGIVIPLPPWVYALTEDTVNFKTMTVQQLDDLYVTVKTLEHHGLEQAKRAEGLIEDQENEEIADLTAELTALKGGLAQKNMSETNSEIARHKFLNFAASKAMMQFVFRAFGGENVAGAFTRIFWQAAKTAEREELNEIAETSLELFKEFDFYYPSRREKLEFLNRRYTTTNAGSFTMNQIVEIAAHMGNVEGQERLRNSAKFPLSDDDFSEIFSFITDRDADYLEASIKITDSLYPAAAEESRKINGIVAPRIEAVPWQLPSGRWMEGGYIRINYNSRIKQMLGRATNEDLPGAGKFVQPYGQTYVRHDHMKQRAKTGGGRTLHLDFLGSLESHIEEVIHATTHQALIIKFQRYLDRLEDPIKEAGGPAIYDAMKHWVGRIADKRRPGTAAWFNYLASMARSGGLVSAMGWNLPSASIQTTGFIMAIPELGTKYTAKGFLQLMAVTEDKGGWYRFDKTITELMETFPVLRDRARSYDRDLARIGNRLKPIDLNPLNQRFGESLDSLRGTALPVALGAHALIDIFISSGVALGSYSRAIEGNAPGIEAGDIPQAIEYANGIVELTQGSGARANLARIMDDGPVMRLFTTFMTWAMTQANLAGLYAFQVREGIPGAKGRFAMFNLLYIFVLPVLTAMMRDLWKSEEGDFDDEDDLFSNSLGDRIQQEIVQAVVGTTPGVRDISAAYSGFGASTAVSQFFSALYNASAVTTQIFVGEEAPTKEAVIKNLGEIGDILTGLPFTAMGDAYLKVEEFAEGEF